MEQLKERLKSNLRTYPLTFCQPADLEAAMRLWALTAPRPDLRAQLPVMLERVFGTRDPNVIQGCMRLLEDTFGGSPKVSTERVITRNEAFTTEKQWLSFLNGIPDGLERDRARTERVATDWPQYFDACSQLGLTRKEDCLTTRSMRIMVAALSVRSIDSLEPLLKHDHQVATMLNLPSRIEARLRDMTPEEFTAFQRSVAVTDVMKQFATSTTASL